MTNKVTQTELNTLGGILVENESSNKPMTQSDNLAIVLCLYFSDHVRRPNPDPLTENGWGEWVEMMVEEALTLMIKNYFVHEK